MNSKDWILGAIAATCGVIGWNLAEAFMSRPPAMQPKIIGEEPFMPHWKCPICGDSGEIDTILPNTVWYHDEKHTFTVGRDNGRVVDARERSDYTLSRIEKLAKDIRDNREKLGK